ncbi:hypothetical protein BJY00DRAFT_289850 [Aspergillus carlsbadensis]|nr:hypothetical protein BJY00DRAFT_289850 [Aspergillus carlsbadensis]
MLHREPESRIRRNPQASVRTSYRGGHHGVDGMQIRARTVTNPCLVNPNESVFKPGRVSAGCYGPKKAGAWLPRAPAPGPGQPTPTASPRLRPRRSNNRHQLPRARMTRALLTQSCVPRPGNRVVVIGARIASFLGPLPVVEVLTNTTKQRGEVTADGAPVFRLL